MSNGMTHSHDAVRERAEDYLLGLLDDTARRELEAEAAGCPICAAELRQLMDVGEGLARLVPPRTPPARVRARVMAIPGAHAHARSAVPRADSRRSFERWLAVAATLAAIAAGSYAVAMRGRVSSLEGQLRSALARVNAAESQLAELRESTGELRRVANVLVAADVRRVDLAGQKPAPAATGRAFLSPERGVVFTASGLPQIPPSQVYQLWYLTAGGPVSAGLFRPDPAGTASTSSVVRPTSPIQGVAVTIEPAGGVPSPTGDMYLNGSL
jgi:anti-sigma-K factor RskA